MPRLFPLLVALLLALTPMARAQDIPASSPMGLDYFDLTKGDTQLAAILLAGEAEFSKSVASDPTYLKLGVTRAWTSYSKNLAKEKVSNQMLDELEVHAPQTLRAFADLPEDKYPLLQAIGDGRIAEDMLERAKLLCGDDCPTNTP